MLDRLAEGGEQPFLLWGSTGSGKTEVYLRQAQRALDAGQQVLMMVPEINLTPQLETRVAERFAGRRIVSLHSGLTPAQRLRNWLMAHYGHADLVLGTRLSVFTPLPRLGLIVVDEEHDPSYKQQDGARYSARDLAVYRARAGRACPSSWARPRPAWRAGTTPCPHPKAARAAMCAWPCPPAWAMADMPQVRLLDLSRMLRPTMGQEPPPLAPELLAAIAQRVERGEQSLVLLNRRGYAPVLHCSDCGWKSGCPHCSAWRVFHKADRTLRCHHCGFSERVPRACPDCGNLDIAPVGRGTERLEEQFAEALPRRPRGRIDADVTRARARWSRNWPAMHAGEVDVLVGTQMVAKGHDFRGFTLVAAVNPDAALFASDFRAAERLFALLLQAAGRAGRDAEEAARSEMWVQTWHPRHPLYQALRSVTTSPPLPPPAARAPDGGAAALFQPGHAARRGPQCRRGARLPARRGRLGRRAGASTGRAVPAPLALIARGRCRAPADAGRIGLAHGAATVAGAVAAAAAGAARPAPAGVVLGRGRGPAGHLKRCCAGARIRAAHRAPAATR